MNTRLVTNLPCKEMEVASGNYDETRATIDRLVLHTMVGTAAGAAARFDNPASKVSAHYGVKEDGTLIHWLEETFTAYHAGNYPMNQRSIGIEHEDMGDYNGVRPDSLYIESAKLVADICKFYNIPIDRQHILKHNEIVATGCPDALDVERIVRMALTLSNPEPMATITQKDLDAMRKERDDNWNLYQADELIIKELTTNLKICQTKPVDAPTTAIVPQVINTTSTQPTPSVQTATPVVPSTTTKTSPTPLQPTNGFLAWLKKLLYG
jgi:N-acetylmuramoyl-L-alanine amidase CwlA